MTRMEAVEMARIDVRGDIIGNEDKWIYDYLEWDATCPNDIRHALSDKPDGECLTVSINSGGGSVMAGQEIYSLLHGREDVEIEIQSLAGSAAAVVAMANKNKISPVAVIMIHNASVSGASGDYHDMQKNAEMLRQINSALASAFARKTGKTEDEILKLMDRETWITANQAIEMGFADEIMKENVSYTNAVTGMRLTDDIRRRVLSEKEESGKQEIRKKNILDDLDSFGV